MSGFVTERYALDPHGRLWPVRYRNIVKAVAIVTVKPLHRRGQPAPEPALPCGRATRTDGVAATRPRPSSPYVPGKKLDLSGAPSGMELHAAAMSAVAKARQRSALDNGPAQGKAFCKCGGNGIEGGFVPAWFGKGCIESDCPLREAKAA